MALDRYHGNEVTIVGRSGLPAVGMWAIGAAALGALAAGAVAVGRTLLHRAQPGNLDSLEQVDAADAALKGVPVRVTHVRVVVVEEWISAGGGR